MVQGTAIAELASAASRRYGNWSSEQVKRSGDPILALNDTLDPNFYNHSESLWPVIQRLLDKSPSSRAITIGVVGGSVSVGAGLPNPNDAWPSVMEAAMRQIWAGHSISIHNAARAATTAGFAALCFDSLFGRAVLDLVVIEYSWNTDRAAEVEALVNVAHAHGSGEQLNGPAREIIRSRSKADPRSLPLSRVCLCAQLCWCWTTSTPRLGAVGSAAASTRSTSLLQRPVTADRFQASQPPATSAPQA